MALPHAVCRLGGVRALCAAGVAFAIAPMGAEAQTAPAHTAPAQTQAAQKPAAQTAPAQTPDSQCDAWRVEYVLSGRLELSDTPLGQGDGIYPVGPGTLVVRLDRVAGAPSNRAKVISYEMHEAIKVVSKTLFWATTVASDTTTRATPDPCGEPEGLLTGNALVWSRPISTFRSEGNLFCSGSFCGKFGAPPAGASLLHIAPHPTLLKSLQFSGDGKTFTMASTLVSKTDVPKQTAHVALSGREVRRGCAPALACP